MAKGGDAEKDGDLSVSETYIISHVCQDSVVDVS